MRYSNRKLFALAAIMLLGSLLLNASVQAADYSVPVYQPNIAKNEGKARPAPISTPLIGCWDESTAYPIAVSGTAATSLGGFIYSFGGVETGTSTTAAYRYDGNLWTAVRSLSTPLSGAAIANDGNYIYIIGGINGGAWVTQTLRYDPSADVYTQLAPPVYANDLQPAVYLDGKIYLIGAGGSASPNDVVEVYSIATNSWSEIAHYPTNIAGEAVMTMNGYIYTAGGTTDGTTGTDKTYRYDRVTNTWDDSIVADLPYALRYAASGLVYSQWVVAGGIRGSGNYDNALVWESAANTWSNLPQMLYPRAYASAIPSGSSLYVIGGRDANNQPTSDNQRYSPGCSTDTPTPTNTNTPIVTNTPTATGTPPTATPTHVPFCGFAPASYYPLHYDPSQVAVADFNLDGKSDMAAVNGPNVSVWLGNGDGSFQNPIDYPVGSRSERVVVSDLNGDAVPDLIVNDPEGNNRSYVYVLLGDGNGGFQPAHSYQVGNLVTSIVAGDFSGDGKADLVLGDGGNGTLLLLPGNGDGTFQPTVSLISYISSWDIVTADFNHDNKLDLAVTSGNAVYVLLGNGDGTFQPPVFYGATLGIKIALGDLNHDNNLDLIGADFSHGKVSVLLGNGDGTFQPVVSYPAGENPVVGTVADFDGDDNLDVVALDEWGQSASLLLGNGDGTFQSPISYGVGYRPFGATAADLNGDGAPDLMVANGGSASIAILLNRCQFSPTPTVTGTPPTATPTRIPQPTVCPNPFVDINGNVFFHAINALYCQGVINGTDATYYSPAGTASRAEFAKIVVLALSVPLTTPANGQSFTDVPPSFFAYVYIESGYAAGILSGFDAQSCASVNAQHPCYLPRAAITRGQLTKLVVNAAHFALLTPTGGPTFTDVPASNIFYAYIETAYANHVINGYPDGSFRPNNNIRRDEMAQIVYTAQLAYGTPTPRPTDTPTVTGTPPTDTPTPTITDTPTPGAATATPTVCANTFVDLVGDPYYNAVLYLYCRGVVEGTDTTHFSPTITATRAVASKALVLGFAMPFYTPATQDFADVLPGNPYYTYIETGFHAGVLAGEDPATCQAAGQVYPCFLPDRAISRAEIAKYIVLAAQYPLYTPTAGQDFTDVPPGDPFYVYIETVYHHGVMDGYSDGTFRPDNSVQRDEMCQFIYNGLTLPRLAAEVTAKRPAPNNALAFYISFTSR